MKYYSHPSAVIDDGAIIGKNTKIWHFSHISSSAVLGSNVSVGQNVYISNTSGSSGHPFYFAKNKEAHSMDWAIIKDRYNWHNLELNSKQARFYGIPLETLTYSKEKMKDYLMNRIRFSIYDLSDEVLWKYLGKFKNEAKKD